MDEMKQLKTGTTTVGLICDKAVVLGADRKATMGYLVASKDTRKIVEISSHLGMTIAGLVGDAMALERYIKAEVALYHLQEEERIPVEAAAHLMANILYARRFFPYYVQLVMGGYDTKPHVFSLAADGSVIEEKEYFSSGSGSPFVFGVLEKDYRKDTPVDQAKKLVATAIHAATQRDIASGGSGIDLVVIDSAGFHKIPDDHVKAMIG
jgi:proteasome beta subunit